MHSNQPLRSFQCLFHNSLSCPSEEDRAYLLQIINGMMSLALCSQVVSQAPQHFRSEVQATCDDCFACQSICSVISLHSMSRTVHPQDAKHSTLGEPQAKAFLPRYGHCYCTKHTLIHTHTHTHTQRTKPKYVREIGKEGGLQTERTEEAEDDESTLALTTCQMNVSATSHLPLFFPLPCTVTCD